MNGRELSRCCQRVVHRAYFPDMWLVIQIRRTARRVAFVAGVGGDLACLSFVAAYDTYTDTMNGLKREGFIGLKDYKARSAEVLATS